MPALFDATNRQSEQDSTRIGLTSSVHPETKRSKTGESVRYALDTNKKWFVLRVSFGRADKAKEVLKDKKIEYYQPMYRTRKMIKGKGRMRTVPFFPSLIFVYVEPAVLDAFIKDKAENPVLSYYYNHFAIDCTGKNPPLTVAYDIMINFIRLTSINDRHIKVVDPNACHYKCGDTVIITEGKFKGITGKLARVSQEQRVVLNIEGVGMVATAYIPTAFVEPYDKDREKAG